MPRSRSRWSSQDDDTSQNNENIDSAATGTGAGAGAADESLHVLEKSGLTAEDRSRIRKSQRELHKDIEERDTLDLEEARDRNNKIYKKVRYTREAVLDGENMILIAHKASQRVDRMIQVPRYDADRLVNKLVEKIREASQASGRNATNFDWEILGEAAGACFNAVPSGVCFLHGPVNNGQPMEIRTRNANRRRVVLEDRDAVEERPEDVKGHTEQDENKLSAIEKSMQDMAKVLKKKVDHRYVDNKRKVQDANGGEVPAPLAKKLRKYGVEIDAFQFLLNPDSFTQTVENIFHYSFLVKKGSAAINVREKGLDIDGVSAKPGMVLKYVKDSANHPPAKQGILALNMKDWRDLCLAYNVEKGDLPHRKINKEAYAASLSQASA